MGEIEQYTPLIMLSARRLIVDFCFHSILVRFILMAAIDINGHPNATDGDE
jgi:hypothetical protein